MDKNTVKQHYSSFMYAKHLTAEYSKSFYISTRLLPKRKQWPVFSLYGFCRHADNLIDNPRDRAPKEVLKEIKNLNKELRIAYRTGESEHPVLSSFIIVAKYFNIDRKYPKELIRGVIMDLKKKRYETFDDLYLFCYRVAGVVGLMMTSILGYKDEKALIYAEKLGIAMQLTNILRDIQEDKDMGRIYLPKSEMSDFGITEQDILDEHMSPKMHDFIKFQVERAHRYYDEAQPGIQMLEPDTRFAIQSASLIYRGILRKIEERDYNPFLGRVYVPQSRKLNILLREVIRSKIQMANEKLRLATFSVGF